MDQASKPGSIVLKAENLWLYPHTAIGSQLEVQGPHVIDLDLWAVRIVMAVVSNSTPITPSFFPDGV